MYSFADENYRREQEAFVSGHGGSTSREVVLAILPNVCSLLVTSTSVGLLGDALTRNGRVVLEFFTIAVNCALCCTILADSTTTVCLATLGISLANLALVRSRRDAKKTIFPVRAFLGRRPFLTNFRALANLMTAVCILAVDFRVFPRKFAKTEVYGFSLMDTGVGLFVLANALVAPEARDLTEPSGKSLLRVMTRNSRECVRNSAPLLILGLGRFVAVELSSYQTHVTEYGVHWNFFVTLAFVKMLTSTVSSTVLSSRYSLVTGIVIIAMHEYALNSGLKNWVLGDSPRHDFVSANREGLSSVPGYVGLYFVGIAIGRLIHSTYANAGARAQERSRAFERIFKDCEKRARVQKGENLDDRHLKNIRSLANLPETRSVTFSLFGRQIEIEYNNSMLLCVKLSLIAVQACAATLYCDSRFQTSRRLANAGYCFWIVTLTCTLLTLLLLVEIKVDALVSLASSDCDTGDKRLNSKKKKRVGFEDHSEEIQRDSVQGQSIGVPEIFEAINYNGLAFFLLANLLTGIINMSVKTLYTKTVDSLFIIVGYIGVCTFVTVALYRYKIQMKF